MKKTFANLVQKSLVTALLVFGVLLIGTSRTEAQSSGSESWPTSWVDVGEAMLRIQTDILQLNNDPAVNSVGSDAYTRARYYKRVHKYLGDGLTIPDAITNGISSDPQALATEEPIPGVIVTPAHRASLMDSLKNRLSL